MRPRKSPVAKRVCVGCLFSDCVVEIVDRTFDVALIEKDDSAVVVCVRVVGIQPNRLVVVAHGSLELVSRAERIATIVEGVGRAWVQSDGFVIVADRLIDGSDAPVRDPAVHESSVVARIQ